MTRNCMFRYSNDSKVYNIKNHFEEEILSAVENSFLIIDHPSGILYANTREELEEDGYSVHVLDLNTPYLSEQYGILMDIFDLMDTHELDFLGFVYMLLFSIIDNTKDIILNDRESELKRMIHVLIDSLKSYHEEGNTNLNEFLDNLIVNKEARKRINERCGQIFGGYDFCLRDSSIKKMALFIIPPEKSEVEDGIEGLFMIPVMLYLFPIIAKYNGRTFIFDVESVGIFRDDFLKELLETCDGFPYCHTIGCNISSINDPNVSKTAEVFFSRLSKVDIIRID